MSPANPLPRQRAIATSFPAAQCTQWPDAALAMSLDLWALGSEPPGGEPGFTLQDPCSQQPHSAPNCPLAFSCSVASGHTCDLSSAQNFLPPAPSAQARCQHWDTGRCVHVSLSLAIVHPEGFCHRCPSQGQLMARRPSGPPAQAAPREVHRSEGSPKRPFSAEVETSPDTSHHFGQGCTGRPRRGTQMVGWRGGGQSPAVSSETQPRHGQLLQPWTHGVSSPLALTVYSGLLRTSTWRQQDRKGRALVHPSAPYPFHSTWFPHSLQPLRPSLGGNGCCPMSPVARAKPLGIATC